MNPDEHPTPREFVRSCDSPGGVTTYTYFVTAPPFSFEHDREKGIYRLTWSDGRVEVFRDKPVRYLVVEAVDESGELKPALTRGEPTYLYLCREEREVR